MEDKIANIVSFIIVILIIFCLFKVCSLGYQNQQTIVCEIKEKWVKRKNNDDLYLVKCGEKVYKIEDLLFFGKFNSSDIYASLEVGKTYEIETSGYRLTFFSEYQNINKYKKTED